MPGWEVSTPSSASTLCAGVQGAGEQGGGQYRLQGGAPRWQGGGGGHQRTGSLGQEHGGLGAGGGREHLRQRRRAVGVGRQAEREEVKVPGRAGLRGGARGPGRRNGGRGGQAAAYGRGGDQPLVGGERARAEVVGDEGDLERLGGHVLQDEISVSGEECRVVVAGVGVGSAEAHEHA